MRILCVFGKHNYGNPDRGLSYEYANFLPAFTRLGHEIAFFESWNKASYRDFMDLNQQLLHTVQATQPELIFCVQLGYEVWTETLAQIRGLSDAVLVNWATDDSWKYEQFSRFLIPYFDLYATTYPQAVEKARRAGHKHTILTQWAANAENLHEPIPAHRCRWAVSFIGTAYGNRTKWISTLRKRGIQVNCHGYGWANGPVEAETIPEIIRHSVISLNFGDSNWMLSGIVPYRSRQIKARLFEVPGSGGFLMSEPAEYIDNYYHPGKDIILFESIDDLAEKIGYYQAHPQERDEIAFSGFNKTRAVHTYDQRFKALFDRCTALKARRSKDTPRKIRREAPDMISKDIRQSYQINALLRYFKQVLLIPCRFLWGAERGPRAARRILFELSWRLCGEKTYSASGLPGRLFYYED